MRLTLTVVVGVGVVVIVVVEEVRFCICCRSNPSRSTADQIVDTHRTCKEMIQRKDLVRYLGKEGRFLRSY